MASKPWIAVDFDHTIWDTPNNRPMEGAYDALDTLRKKYLITIHSCNSKEWIEKMCAEHYLHYDAIWDLPGKPVAVAYIDDRGYRFNNWDDTIHDLLNGDIGKDGRVW